MASKKTKLNLLKQRITAMKSQLIAMQTQKHSLEKPFSQKRKVPQTTSHSTSKNKLYKNPTFWTTNPLTFDAKYSPQKQQTPSPHRKILNKSVERQISPNIKNILSTVDGNYYKARQPQPTTPAPITAPYKKHSYQGKRYENSQFGRGYTDIYKQNKKKTYIQKKTNPILDPEKYKQTGIKIVKAKSKSPDNMLILHPNSNPNVYTFPTQTVIVPRKGSLKDKTKSSLSLNSSLGELVAIKFDKPTPKRKKSQKKHFGQYYRENFSSHFEFD